MASWKKVLVSGSSVEIASITSSATPSIASLTGYNVLMIDNTGKVNQITAGNFNAGLSTGSYSFTASAVNGGTFPIGDQAILRISGSGGLTTTLSTVGSTTTIDVSANVGNGLQVVSNTLTLNTGSTHFIAGVDNEVFKSANFVDSSEIDFTVSAGASVTAALINGSIANARLTNSTISGVALGSNLNTLTLGSGLTGTSYNGSSAVTATVNSGSMVAYFTGSAFSAVSGDILIAGNGVATIQAGAVAISTDVSGLGVGVATALGNAVGAAGSFVVNGGVLGTPSSGTLTNATGLPVGTGISGLGTSVATALAVNVGTAGSIVVNGGALGTPSSGTLTNATGLPISGLVSSTSTALGVGSLELGNASDTTLARVSAGVVSIEGNNIITANNFGSGIATFLATPSSANFASALTDETGTAGSVVFSVSPTFTGTANFASIGAAGDLSVTGNTAIAGNLLVAGTASFQNTQNLLVADKFILLASGSTTLNDGGIIVAYNTAGSGSALFLEAGTAGSTGTYGRFAVAYDVASGVSTQAADEFVVTAKTAASPPPGVPTWGGAVNGYGNIHVNSANGDIFIYS